VDGRSGHHANRVGQHRGRMSVVLENLRARTLGVLLLPALSLIALPASSTEIPAAQKQSDYESMSPQTRAIQDDDSVNPGMFWVLDGEEQWGRKDGSSNLSCADCHTSEVCVGSLLATLRSKSNHSARLIFRSVSTSAARGVRMRLRWIRKQRAVGPIRFCRLPIAWASYSNYNRRTPQSLF
jgi:hypothetical protein